jgi:hypothetical protein
MPALALGALSSCSPAAIADWGFDQAYRMPVAVRRAFCVGALSRIGAGTEENGTFDVGRLGAPCGV